MSPRGQQPIARFYPRNTKPKQKQRPLGTNVDSYKPAKRSLSHNRNDYNPRDGRVCHLNSMKSMSNGSVMHVPILVFSM